MSARRFISYGILIIDIAAEFCSWTDQWPKQIFNFSRLGLAETPEVLNTTSEGNSLNFRWSNKQLQTVTICELR
jgi:hypothetical protein